MRRLFYITVAFVIARCGAAPNQTENETASSQKNDSYYAEQYRPQIHFSPEAHWMNDPNGMVFYNGTYHLFYQYYPDSTVWGPMHWGHATSTDLVHWQHQPIALYPDSMGLIFSGSAVVDSFNTSGFGKDGKFPLLAVFTQHDMKGEKAGTDTFQTQSIAYSLDEGKTWTKYAGNPVLRNPGIKDFRDPKVMWYAPQKKWVMTLATKDRVTFYSSPNFKSWTKESEFGDKQGAHGGVWECPDLFGMEVDGKTVWVLLVSINPGGPNGGSATQYFVGDFDGKAFKPYHINTKWVDYGTDDYAGVTWSNTGNRKIFLGWMSNWLYATTVPTEKWRSAMTVPREINVKKIDNNYLLSSLPVKELNVLNEKPLILENIDASSFDLTAKAGKPEGPLKMELNAAKAESFSITFSNEAGEKLIVGYNKDSNQYFIDRRAAGQSSFNKEFAKMQIAPRLAPSQNLQMTLMLDAASVELFADNGLSVMTAVFFPLKPYTNITLHSPQKLVLNTLQVTKLKSIWR